jgi:hypothetical protein
VEEPDRDPASENPNTDQTIDLTTDAKGDTAGIPDDIPPHTALQPYVPEKQRDYVRLIVTVGLLLMLGWVIVWSCFESASWADHWAQTKEMLQIILPALTGLIGSVIGFYFGSGINNESVGNSNPAKDE